jgi:hypothetical protein
MHANRNLSTDFGGAHNSKSFLKGISDSKILELTDKIKGYSGRVSFGI